MQVAADGQPVAFETSFRPGELSAWLAHARDRLGRRALGVAVGACPRCRAPLALAPEQPVSLPCPHCGTPVVGSASAVLVDQWTEPWSKVEGAGLDLEYRLAFADESAPLPGCPRCGLQTQPGPAELPCPRCGGAVWTEREGKRLQLGVRVDGTRSERPFRTLLPIVQGEAALRSDAASGATAATGQSILGVTGVGCAIAVGFAMLVATALVVAIKLLLK